VNPKTVVIVCGPTAVGKTSLAIQLAKYFNTQIISADSRQCFKELNIGVAKPSRTELRQVHHYFINSHSIHDEVNAASFEQYAIQKADEVFEENDTAILVGGTGFYIKAFCEGLDIIPTIPDEIRNSINQQYNTKGLAWLQNELQTKDPLFWQTAEQQNPQRLTRALEVIEATGKSINSFRTGEKLQRPFNIIKIGLELPREQLYERINQRVNVMMQEGLLEEVKDLIPFKKLNALQTVGYKEFFEYLDGVFTLEQAIEVLKKHTRHYAKRQMTWFKKDEQIQWFQPFDLDLILNHIRTKK
jgi:tRNA dimethylallyltransferase